MHFMIDKRYDTESPASLSPIKLLRMQLEFTQPTHLLLSSRDPPLPRRDRVPDISCETNRPAGDDPDRGVGWETVEPAREEREQVGPAAFDRPLLGAPTAAAGRREKKSASRRCEFRSNTPFARKGTIMN